MIAREMAAENKSGHDQAWDLGKSAAGNSAKTTQIQRHISLVFPLYGPTQVAGKFPAEFGGCRRRFWRWFSLDAKNANLVFPLIRASVGPETVPFRNKGIVHSLEEWVPSTALPQPWRLKDAQGGS